MGQQDGLPWAPGFQSLTNPGGFGGGADLERQPGHVRAVGGRDRGEPIAEGADGHGQHAVAGGEEVDDRGFEPARAGGREDEDVVCRPVERLEPIDDPTLEGCELGPAMVDHLAGTGFPDGIGERCRSWYSQVGLELVHAAPLERG